MDHISVLVMFLLAFNLASMHDAAGRASFILLWQAMAAVKPPSIAPVLTAGTCLKRPLNQLYEAVAMARIMRRLPSPLTPHRRCSLPSARSAGRAKQVVRPQPQCKADHATTLKLWRRSLSCQPSAPTTSQQGTAAAAP